MKTRFFHIDFLRAVAITGVMLTHSLALFLGPKSINSAWNYLHFVVVGFVFCSGYVTTLTHTHTSLVAWYQKRFVRLYVPFVLYVVAYMIVSSRSFSSHFFTDSLTFLGGVDVGWLTLLFLQLTILTPLLLHIDMMGSAAKVVFIVLGVFSIITLFIRIPTVYSRAVAWLPWSFIFLLGRLYATCEKSKSLRTTYLPSIGIVSFIIWILLKFLLIHWNQPITLTLHKYPPDIFYFLYGISINSFLLLISSKLKNLSNGITRLITFISKNSYGMFFIHLLTLEALTKFFSRLTVVPVILVSITTTLSLLYGWSLLLLISKRNVSRVNTKR